MMLGWASTLSADGCAPDAGTSVAESLEVRHVVRNAYGTNQWTFAPSWGAACCAPTMASARALLMVGNRNRMRGKTRICERLNKEIHVIARVDPKSILPSL